MPISAFAYVYLNVCMCLSPRWHASISALTCVYLRVCICLSPRWHVSISALACVYLNVCQKHKRSYLRVGMCLSPRWHVSISAFARVYLRVCKRQRWLACVYLRVCKREARENGGLHVSISGLHLPSRTFIPFCAFHGCAREGQEFCGCTWTHSAIMCTADEPRAAESVRSRPLRSSPFAAVRFL